MADPVITADDVVRAGACASGVAKVVQRLHKRLAAAMPVSQVLRLVGDENKSYVLQAAELDGSGDGSGSGYGYGSGSGSSDGSGDGYGYGSSDGSGSSDGYGDGYG